MKYEIKQLPGMIIVQRQGKTREETKAELDDYLNEVGLKAETYFYLEVFSGGKVSGAVTMAKVETEPEHNKRFRSREVKEETYLTLEMTYQEYKDYDNSGAKKEFDINAYIKEQGYKLKDWPIFEFVPELGEDMIRVYIMIE